MQLPDLHVFIIVNMLQKNRELDAEAAANKKKEAGGYDVVVRQLQFEMKAKVCCVICIFHTLIVV